jgi:hypothetical protein
MNHRRPRLVQKWTIFGAELDQNRFGVSGGREQGTARVHTSTRTPPM